MIGSKNYYCFVVGGRWQKTNGAKSKFFDSSGDNSLSILGAFLFSARVWCKVVYLPLTLMDVFTDRLWYCCCNFTSILCWFSTVEFTRCWAVLSELRTRLSPCETRVAGRHYKSKTDVSPPSKYTFDRYLYLDSYVVTAKTSLMNWSII